MPRRNRRKFTAEQRAGARRMVRKVGNLAKVAGHLDLTETSSRNWVKQAEIDEGRGPDGALANDEREERSRESPPVWLSYLPLPPLGLLWFTGLYSFVLPYATKWRGDRRAACGSS